MSLRATLRGAHEGLAAPLVVEHDGRTAEVERRGGARSSLRTAAGGTSLADIDPAGAASTRHDVLLLPLEREGSAAARRVEVVVDGWRFEVEVEPEQRAALRERARRDRGDAGHSGPAEVHAIIPGVVVSIAVAPGDAVEAGQQLLVVEAMKMQNEIRAPRAGTVERVAVGERSTIEVGDLLVVLD